MATTDWSMLLRLVPAFSIAFALAGALHDAIARTIPNRWCAAIALLGLLARVGDGSLAAALVVFGAVFILSALCWRAGWLGGGDVKLLSALSLAVPPHLAPSFIADTSLAGALLALVYLLARGRMPRLRGLAPAGLAARAIRAECWRLNRGGPLPYGIAIAAGAIIALTRGAF